MRNNPDLLQKAKNYAYLLLKFRPRSEKELYQRLKKKKFDEQIIQETLTFLKDKRFIDDRDFAQAWVESRIKKPLGIRRIREELKFKGIDKEIIDNTTEKAKEDYFEQDIVTKLARGKLERLKNIEPLKAKRRVLAFLLRRGFSPDIVVDTINQL